MEQDLYKRAKLRCMHLLEKRDYTEKQLRDKLRNGKTEYTEDMIDEAINYVKSFHYVDDDRYARRYIECMQKRKSRRVIAQELMQKGISREQIQEAEADVTPADEAALIREWMRKRRYDPATADLKEKQRFYAFLMRKGFRFDSIAEALRIEEN
ncbi:MAG: regulatory protein RecX [Eubacteriales bacterium]|nr:regulatory protein RecX [Eubacteriales bacterium]